MKKVLIILLFIIIASGDMQNDNEILAYDDNLGFADEDGNTVSYMYSTYSRTSYINQQYFVEQISLELGTICEIVFGDWFYGFYTPVDYYTYLFVALCITPDNIQIEVEVVVEPDYNKMIDLYAGGSSGGRVWLEGID